MGKTDQKAVKRMNETTFTLSQKAILQIQPMEEPRPSFQLLEFLQCLVYDAVRQEYGFEPDWERFRSYGAEETPDQTKRIQTATLYGEEDEALRQWALRLSLRDGNVRRRKWLLHIGIDVRKPDTAMLYYALMYYDHKAGSFSDFRKPSVLPAPLLHALNHNHRIACSCGSFRLPGGAIAIDEGNLMSVMQLIRDPKRWIPVIVITCPDLISPVLVEKEMIGNAIVCWLDDMETLEALNNALAPDIFIEWDSVQAILPEMTGHVQHPRLTIMEISRFGRDAVVGLLRQAYCESLRSEDRRAFVTVDDICRQRDRRLTVSLQKRLAEASAERSLLKETERRLREENEQLRQTNAKLSSEEAARELSSCEALLSESMAQYDALRSGVLDLTQRLYGSIGQSFSPKEAGEACLCDLEHAIFLQLAAKQGRK